MRTKQLFLILALLCAIVQGAWAQANLEEVYAMTGTTSANWTALTEGSTLGKTIGTQGNTTYYYTTNDLSFTNSTSGGSDKVNTRFLMKIGSADTGPESYTVRLQYYCKKLNHIFTLSEKVNMDTDLTLGIDEEYVPEFTLGSAKYPVVKTVTAESILASVGITPQRNGIMAAFVGDECRGVTQFVADPNLRSTELTIYRRTAGESVTLKYYDAVKRVVYTFADPVKM